MFIPHLSLPNSRFAGVKNGNLPFAAFANADVVVVQRLNDQTNWRAITEMGKHGLKIVYDLDDNMWNIPKYNPAYNVFVDKEGFRRCAIETNVVTVSTPQLKKVAEENINFRGLEFAVIPNAMDTRIFRPLPALEPDPDRPVLLAWAGTATHSMDLLQVFRELPALLRKEPKMHLAVTGMRVPELEAFDQFHQIDFVPVSQYPAALASWRFDIMLAPLEDNPFNRCKSNIKILEAAAMGVPILVSPVTPYSDFAARDPELSFMVCKTTAQWSTKIRQLIHEPALRSHLVMRMRKVMEEHFSIEVVKEKWLELARSIT